MPDLGHVVVKWLLHMLSTPRSNVPVNFGAFVPVNFTLGLTPNMGVIYIYIHLPSLLFCKAGFWFATTYYVPNGKLKAASCVYDEYE